MNSYAGNLIGKLIDEIITATTIEDVSKFSTNIDIKTIKLKKNSSKS